MQKLFLLVLGVVLFVLNSVAQDFTDLSQPIPFDKNIRHGVLPNGLTYYIMHNENPKGRASFYIYQNVGASLETDKQNGLAHFLEHMAFNGTKTFPGNSMIDMLERHGVKFGKDINAYTTRNETVYNLSRVPTNNKALVDSCLMILHDWCDDVSLTEKDINDERGVISEEWRTRHNADLRVRTKIAPIIYNGSIYADRDVIGDLNVIKNFDPKDLRAFYHDWYRTDLQAVGIVGDIDVDAVEKEVKELFSAIPAVKNPKKRTQVVIPDNEKPMYVLATDKEYKNVSIGMKVRFADAKKNTLESVRQSYVTSFFNSLIAQRLKEVIQKGDAPFLSASIGFEPLERGYSSFNVSTVAKEGKQAEAFEAVYTELERVIKYGFTEPELDRLKTNMLTSVENNYTKRDQINTETYCQAIKQSYLEKVAVPGAEFNYQFAKEIIPGITTEELTALASKYLGTVNRNYIIKGPEDEKEPYITAKEIEEVIAKVESANISPYVDDTPPDSKLLSTNPVAGKIVSEKKIKPFDAIEWTLSNGAKVVFRRVDEQKQMVALSAVSYGGTSLYGPEDIPSLDAIGNMVPQFGLGDHDPIQYKKVMTGKTAGCNFKLNQLGETINANAVTKDLKTMFQLVYMRFEEPRFDKDIFDNLMQRYYYNVEHKVKTPKTIMQDTLTSIFENGNPRALKVDKAYLDEINFDRMKTIYHQRFSNASDFTFFITGDTDPETIKPLVEKYIGSIGGNGAAEKWKDNGDYFPKGKHYYRIYIPMEEPKATVLLKLQENARYSRKAAIYQRIIESILNLRYTENIREKEGGAYVVNVNSSLSRKPEERMGFQVNFNCDPERADHLKQLMNKELVDIQKMVQQSDLDKVVLNMKKNREQIKKDNAYWLSALLKYYEYGENVQEASYFDDILNHVTTKDIEKAAQRFFKNADSVEIVFLPEKES